MEDPVATDCCDCRGVTLEMGKSSITAESQICIGSPQSRRDISSNHLSSHSDTSNRRISENSFDFERSSISIRHGSCWSIALIKASARFWTSASSSIRIGGQENDDSDVNSFSFLRKSKNDKGTKIATIKGLSLPGFC